MKLTTTTNVSLSRRRDAGVRRSDEDSGADSSAADEATSVDSVASCSGVSSGAGGCGLEPLLRG